MIITVYGAETACPSCLHSPSSRETMEWLDAAVKRKFPNDDITVRYIDIYSSVSEDDKEFTSKILNDEYFYPLVVANGLVIGEGDPKLKNVFSFLESRGLKSV